MSTQNPSDLKAELRQQAIRQRGQIQPKPDDSDKVISLFQSNIDIGAGMIVAGYWPIKSELDISSLILELAGKGHQIALPCISKETQEMFFVPWNEKTKMVKGQYGIPEPDSNERLNPDIVITPLLAFDRKGTRLGYGKGYYDKALSSLRKEKQALSVGIAYDQQICLFPLPSEEHDIRLDWVITPDKAYNFKT